MVVGSRDNEILNFRRQTVKDFLMGDSSQAKGKWYYTTMDEANLLIFDACWRYLRAKESKLGDLVMRKVVLDKLFYPHASLFTFCSRICTLRAPCHCKHLPMWSPAPDTDRQPQLPQHSKLPAAMAFLGVPPCISKWLSACAYVVMFRS